MAGHADVGSVGREYAPLRRRTLHPVTGKPSNRPAPEAGNDRSSVSEPQLSITSERRVGEKITRSEQDGSDAPITRVVGWTLNRPPTFTFTRAFTSL